ncbi:SurA N-terminal domain-containing protein, partial [bacterium]|nr:SurA N-terminal domain-containing protein [bacterium]
MLRTLRKKSKPILWFVIIFISFVFIIWGVGSGGRKDQATYVAQVNGKKISLNAFQNLYEKYHKDYSQFYLDKEELNREAKKFALEEFIRYHLLLEEAKREKIGV